VEQRARQELRATGVTIGRRTPDARPLTAQELQIAQLAAEEPRIVISASACFSARTVGGHLCGSSQTWNCGRAQLH
jgi:hypothetical protein